VPALDLGPPAREVIGLLDGVADDRLGDPTPCADTSVAGLLDHLMGLSLAFTWAARKTTAAENLGGADPQSAAQQLDPGWRTELPRRLDDLVAAWRDPAAWDGMTEAGGVRMTAEQTAAVAVDELVLHGWDLARATGQPFHCDPVSTEVVLAFTTEAARPENAGNREGLFGPVVDVPQDTPAFERALGLAGRDPGWQPPAR
jgi:uncharacterized protein (TIGR03086 family)